MKVLQTNLLLVLFMSWGIYASAQVKLPVSNLALRNDVQKLIDDFSRQFSELKGDVQSENPQTVEYSCLLQVSGAESSIITRHSGARPIYSFQAIMLTTEDFEEATNKYKWLYHQLKGMTVRLNRDYTFSLTGDYDAPEESRKFASSILNLLPAATNLPKLKIEASMQYEFPEWKVSLLIYERERRDEERGPVEEEEEQ